MTPVTRDVFDGATAERRLSDYFAVATTEAFGALSRLELNAAAACVTYVERTQLGKRPPLSPPVREAQGATLVDRPGDAGEPRAHAHARGRTARLAARLDRPHRDVGRLAAAGATAGRAADRPRRDRRPARQRRRFRRRRRSPARRPASFSTPRPTCRARCRGSWSAAADRAILPRSATASGGRESAGQAARCAGRHAGRDRRSNDGAAAARPGAGARSLAQRLADELPLFKRDGGFVRDGYQGRARRIPRVARRVPPGHRRASGALRRRHRREVAQDPPQQRARLFRRRHRAARRQADERAAERDLHPPPDAWPARFASPRPSSANWRPRSPAPPTARSISSWRFSSGCPPR